MTRPLGGSDFHMPDPSAIWTGAASPAVVEAREMFFDAIEELAPQVVEELDELASIHDRVMRLVEERFSQNPKAQLPVNLGLGALEAWIRYFGSLDRSTEPIPEGPIHPGPPPLWLGTISSVFEMRDQVTEFLDWSAERGCEAHSWFDQAWNTYQAFLSKLLGWGRNRFLLDPWILEEAVVNLSIRRRWEIPSSVWAGQKIFQRRETRGATKSPDGPQRIALQFGGTGFEVKPPAYKGGYDTWKQYGKRLHKWKKTELPAIAQQHGLEPAPTKTSGLLHFRWLVRFQVLGEKHGQIARSPLRPGKSGGGKGYTGPGVQRELRKVSELIGLTRRTVSPFKGRSLAAR